MSHVTRHVRAPLKHGALCAIASGMVHTRESVGYVSRQCSVCSEICAKDLGFVKLCCLNVAFCEARAEKSSIFR